MKPEISRLSMCKCSIFANMEQHHLSAKTYRYFTSEVSAENTDKPILIALHGYGQLAQYFIQKFKILESTYSIVAPEGPHRFYLNGTSGRVGASWMTKEAREIDIFDNLNWLQDLLAKLQAKDPNRKVSLLGFSQGGATAARWFAANPAQFETLILWAAVFPPDLEMGNLPKTQNLHFALGNQDEYFQGAVADALKSQYVQRGFQMHLYEGKHDIDVNTLNAILG